MQHDFILLDRSGSMQGDKWIESINAINSYVHNLDKSLDTGVTLAAFDRDGGNLTYLVLRDRIIPATWQDVAVDEVSPRGMTPLNDAILHMVAAAKQGNYDRVALIIVTDGHENASVEDREGVLAKAALADCRARGWQVIMLGADYENMAQARGLGNQAAQTVSASSVNLGAVMRSTAIKRGMYGATGQSVSYSEEEKVAWKSKKAPEQA